MARLTLQKPIKLWIAADEAGFFLIFRDKPERSTRDGLWGVWEGNVLKVVGLQELKRYTNEVPRWEDEPIMVEI